jgi:peptidoglycan/LPS O-acetylase OafA/YrhL
VDWHRARRILIAVVFVLAAIALFVLVLSSVPPHAGS